MRPALFVILACALAASGVGPAAAVPPNVQVNTLSNSPEETAIAINPTNLSNVIGVAQAGPCRYYTSMNGGLTWTDQQLPDPFDLGDPAIVFGPEGIAYYAYIGLYSHSGIFVNRSTDGGQTWRPAGTPIVEHDGGTPFEDKEWPAVDWTGGPHGGNVYVAWTRFDVLDSTNPADSTRIFSARSTDHGLTFSAPQRVSDRAGRAIDSSDAVEGAVPSVGPDGTVYLAWAGPRGIEFDRSTDGGATWGTDRVITDQPGGWDFNVAGIYRCNGLPETRTDLGPGPFGGRLYVLWTDRRNGDPDVFVIRSDDRGNTWSPRTRVNTDAVGNGADQFFPWLDVDPVFGTVSVVFYDRREHPGTATTDVYLATSTDGGGHFTNEKISASPFVPNANVFFGDYIGVSAYAGRVRPLWMRLDGNTLSLWTALIDPNPADSASGPFAGAIRVVPNPVRTEARIFLSQRAAAAGTVELVDGTGRIVRTFGSGTQSFIWNGRDAAGRVVPSGIYFLRSGDLPAARLVVVR